MLKTSEEEKSNSDSLQGLQSQNVWMRISAMNKKGDRYIEVSRCFSSRLFNGNRSLLGWSLLKNELRFDPIHTFFHHTQTHTYTHTHTYTQTHTLRYTHTHTRTLKFFECNLLLCGLFSWLMILILYKSNSC